MLKKKTFLCLSKLDSVTSLTRTATQAASGADIRNKPGVVPKSDGLPETDCLRSDALP